MNSSGCFYLDRGGHGSISLKKQNQHCWKQTGAEYKGQCPQCNNIHPTSCYLPPKPFTSLRNRLAFIKASFSHRNVFSQKDAFKKAQSCVRRIPHTLTRNGRMFLMKAVKGVERSKWLIRHGQLLIFPLFSSIIHPLHRLCFLSVTLNILYYVPENWRFLIFLHTLWTSLPDSTSMCVEQSVALQQLAFKIQYKLLGFWALA